MPTVTGTFRVHVQPSQQQNPLVITPNDEDLPNGTVGTEYSSPVAVVSGGTPPYNYAYNPNSPNKAEDFGCSLSEDGNGNITLSGTPSASGDFTLLFDVTDSAGSTQQASLTKKIS